MLLVFRGVARHFASTPQYNIGRAIYMAAADCHSQEFPLETQSVELLMAFLAQAHSCSSFAQLLVLLVISFSMNWQLNSVKS